MSLARRLPPNHTPPDVCRNHKEDKCKSAKSQAGTISCTGVTSTLTFTPPLVPGTATSKTDQTTITGGSLTGCTTDPASNVTAATSVTAKATKSKNGNSCSSLASTAHPTKFTFTVVWNGGGGKSKISFVGDTANTSPPGFTLTGGKETGSFPSTSATVTANLDTASGTEITNCILGLSTASVPSLVISTGTSSG